MPYHVSKEVPISIKKQKSRSFWNRCYVKARYDYKRLARKDWSNLIKRLKRNEVIKVLDLGCGYGTWSIVMARAGFKVKAIDISKIAVGNLKKWAAEENLRIRTQVSSVQKLKTIEKFNAIICNSVLDHLSLDDAKTAINKIRNMLNHNGLAYISFDGPSEDEEDKKGFMLLDDGTRYYTKGKFKDMLWRYYSDKEIKDLLRAFKILEFRVAKNGRRYVWIKKKSKLSI